MKEDFYNVLGLSKNATPSEIKSAYRKMAVKYHPDKNSGDKTAEEKFKKAAEAYEILSDASKKEKYDRYGHAAFDGGGSGFGGGGGMDMDDIFSRFGDIFGDTFGGGGGFGGFGGSRGGARVKGSNLRIRVKLTLEEVLNGVEKKVKVKRKVKASGVSYRTCATCNGSGQMTRITNTILGRMQTATTCSTCRGSGEVMGNQVPGSDSDGLTVKEEAVSIKIPPGVTEGIQLKVNGKGNAAPGNNSLDGDLIVLIEEIEHSKFKREGVNLHYDLFITFSEAVLGATKLIETLSGKVKIKIEQGTQSGKILRLRGKGLTSLDYSGKGDILIHTNVWTPQELTKEQLQFFESMKEDENFKPTPSNKDKSFIDRMKDLFS